MRIAIIFVHVIVSVFLILVVLLQTGKRADLAGAFGGGGSQTAFGPRGGASVLSRATTVAAVLFMITSMSLAILTTRSARQAGSVLDEVAAPPPASAPASTDGTSAPPLDPDNPLSAPADATETTGEPTGDDDVP